MNKKFSDFAAAVLAFIFSPLAFAQPYVPSEIPVSNRVEVVTLVSHYTFPFKPAEWPVGAGLLAGTYKAERENENGVFYRGDNRSVVVRGLEGKTSVKRYALMVGGFWMPKNTSTKPKIYFYVEKSYPSVGDLEELTMQTADAPEADAATALGLATASTQAATIGTTTGINPHLTGAPLMRSVYAASVGAAVIDAILLASVTGNEGKINYWWMPIDDKEFLSAIYQSHALALAGKTWP